MRKEERNNKLMMECYTEIYAVSNPPADFQELMDNAPINDRGQKEIPFMDHEIEYNDYLKIVNKLVEKYKLSRIEKRQFKTSVALGCSPKFTATSTI